MWIAHYASGLVAKPFAPDVPLSLLTLAGVLPDVSFFILQFFGIEGFNLDQSLVSRGCFPDSNDYPYSHSLLGMALAGILLAVIYRLRTSAPVTLTDQVAIVAASMSHFLLEWPSHREDIKITLHDSYQLGAGMFDHTVVTFFVECAIFLAGICVYTSLAPMSTKTGYKTHRNRLLGITLFIVWGQANFSFAPRTISRWVHAPLFLLGSCRILGKLES